jgi:formylglycine-generating enzyme required for sulfatase activity
MKKGKLTSGLQKLSFAILIILFAFGAVVSCDNGFVIAILPSRDSGAKKEYTNLKLDPIEFSTTGHITKTYGDAPFTNAVKSGYKGGGLITYSSSNTSVATVNGSGQVTILRVGSTIITAEKVADAVYANAQTNYTLTVNSMIDMVSIPAGTFTMGSPTSEANRDSDETQHSVTLSAFYMGKYQVTQEQYQAVMGTNPSNFKSAVTGESGTPVKLPVEQVSWYDALVFCNKLSMMEGLSPAYKISGSTDPAVWGGVPTSSNTTWNAVEIVAGSNGYRLPTEAQWEYACRAGTTTAYNTGNAISENTGWYTSNSGSKTHEVGKKPANARGLYDMHGNVWEWCWDWYGSSYYSSSPTNDPLGASSGTYRVLRGGSWGGSAGNLRSALRSYGNPSSRYNYYGFRLIRP